METRDFNQDEWHDMISTCDDLSLVQTWEFAEAKTKTGPWKVWRVAFRDGKENVGLAQAMIRVVPFLGRGLVWINRAPLLKNKNEGYRDLYINMLRELKRYWVDEKKMYLRIAPPLTVSDEAYESFIKAGYRRATKTDGWASEIVDLSLSVEDLRQRLYPKWRGSLNKAERLGITYQSGTSDVLLEELLDDYKQLLWNKRFHTYVTPEFIRIMQNLLPDSRKMLIFAGRHGQEKLGSILVAPYGKVGMYLIGATKSAGRKKNASHYLLWNAVCEMKKRGYRWFDVGGAHPQDTPEGIYFFKRGLSGEPYQLTGDIEVYYNGFINRMIRKRMGF